MRGLPRTTHGDVADADQWDRIGLLLEYPLVEEEVAQIDPRAIEPGEEVKERVVTSLHEGSGRRASEPVPHYTGKSFGRTLGASSPGRS